MQNSPHSLLALSILVLFSIIYLYNNTKKPLTQKSYLVNSYVYLFLMIILLVIFCILIYKHGNQKLYTNFIYFGILIASFFVIYFIITLDEHKQIEKHILLLIFIMIMAYNMFPYLFVNIEYYKKNMVKIIGIVLCVFIGLSYLAHQNDSFKSFETWRTRLIYGLIILLGLQLYQIFFTINNLEKATFVNWFAIGLFILFIIYDTKILIKQGKELELACGNLNNHLACADYPKNILNLFLDILNLFTNITQVN